jgi:hypothetical protein
MDRQAQILDRMVAVSIGLADFVEYNHSHVSSSRTSPDHIFKRLPAVSDPFDKKAQD